MTTTVLEHVEAPVTQTGDEPPKYSHIVWPKQQLTDAIINGTPVEALCGHTWVPGRDPRQYPVCGKCIEAFETKFPHGEFGDRGEFE